MEQEEKTGKQTARRTHLGAICVTERGSGVRMSRVSSTNANPQMQQWESCFLIKKQLKRFSLNLRV